MYPLRRFRRHLLRCGRENVLLLGTSKSELEEEWSLEREMISKEDSGSKIDLEEIQESADEETIVNTDTQQEVVTPVKPDDISLPIRQNKPSNLP
ncbi:hypothetical protein Tco_0848024 [Tanacetum coccineum]